MADLNEITSRISEISGELNALLQDSVFDTLSYTKRKLTEEKISSIGDRCVTRIFLGHHLEHCAPLKATRHLTKLAPEFLRATTPELNLGDVVLLTNNDVGSDYSSYINFYQKNPQAFFVIWDWDAQHWIQMSARLSMNCDAYISGNSENSFLLSHFNPVNLGPIFIGAHQWSRKFILKNFDLLLQDRNDAPLGVHGFYAKYARRNRAVKTFGNTFPSVNFGTNEYKDRSALSNLSEWANHKVHFIAPVMGGVPIRVYNALITGGIPLVPSFYKSFPEVDVLGEAPFYYDVKDLIDPRALVDAAIERFNEGGKDGVLDRVIRSLDTHHIDFSCELIFQQVEKLWKSLNSRQRSEPAHYVALRQNSR